MKFCDRIRARREELNLSQDELAKRMGYKSRSTINKIELGINDVSQSKIIAFAKALNTTVGYLMGDEEKTMKKAVDTSKVTQITAEQHTENLTVKEFNDFARYVESFGYYIRLAKDNSGYNIYKDDECAYFSTEDFKVLVRSSRLTVKALIDNSLELKKP